MSDLPAAPLPAEGSKLHHFGFVVPSIPESVASFIAALGSTWDNLIVLDPIQKVRVTFLAGRHPSDPLLELIEPAAPDSPVLQFLQRTGNLGGLNHLCYEVPDLDAHLRFCKSVGTAIIRPPVPAVAFNGRRIAWGLTKKRLLLEFLEL